MFPAATEAAQPPSVLSGCNRRRWPENSRNYVKINELTITEIRWMGTERKAEGLQVVEQVPVAHLLAQDQEPRFLTLDEGPEDLRHGERVHRQSSVDGDMDRPVSAHGEGGPEGVHALRGPYRDGHNLRGSARFPDAEGLLEGDLAEGVHRHLHVARLHPGLTTGTIGRHHKSRKGETAMLADARFITLSAFTLTLTA